MGIEQTLASMGYQPKGTIDRSSTGRLLRNAGSIAGLLGAVRRYQQKEQEEQMNKVSMYKTLRDSGYTSQQAYDAVLSKSGFPKPEGNDIKEQRQQAELEETKARTNYYNKRATEPDVKITFNDRVKAVQSGEIEWEDLEDEYPSKVGTISKLKKQLTPVEKSPAFKEGRGLAAKFSPNVAKMTPKAQRMINQIKTQAKLDEFLADVDNKIAAGEFSQNDKNTVLEYFGLR